MHIQPRSHARRSARRVANAASQARLLRDLAMLAAALILIACGTAAPSPAPTSEPGPISEAPTQPAASPTPRQTEEKPSLTPARTATPRPVGTQVTATTAGTPTPVSWQAMSIVPRVSDRTRQVYQRGVELGRDPHAFAKIGDCGGTPNWFLGPFDGPEDQYRLGDFAYLKETVSHFSGSFGRESVAARPGFNVSSIFSPLWADPSQCRPGEGPLICEIRVTNASFALFMMGSNDLWHQEEFEPQMRRAIEDLIERGVVPILSTKADNVEQDGSLNATIVRLAQEYELPLWNFWASVQHLPDYGLQEDGVHLTWAGNRFDDENAMSHGWPWRNLTALQALDAVWRGVTEEK